MSHYVSQLIYTFIHVLIELETKTCISSTGRIAYCKW